ncbi:sodium:calcium antiporter [Verrucomicrobia bacterium S94]|nr:sodium:calcium antiporter [Verrucomicrobia bacterium S94]
MQFFEQLIGTQSGLVLAFIATAALVVAAGIKLSMYGDALGSRTGLGNGLIGLIFLAGVTSLPELVVSLTSVFNAATAADGADLAIGNMLGSNVFNLLILAFMALFFTRYFKPTEMKSPHMDSAIYGLVMLGLFAVAYIRAPCETWMIPGLDCSAVVLALPLFYLGVLLREHRQHKNAVEETEEHLPEEDALTHMPAVRFYSILLCLCALIIGGGVILSILGSRMALPPEQGGFGLEASLIGTIFLAISTSLPELVISFSSIRLGFLDMAVGNVFGSNMFNLLIIFVADVAMRKASLLTNASSKHWTSVMLIFVLTLTGSLLLKTKTRTASLSVAACMVILYAAAMAFFI